MNVDLLTLQTDDPDIFAGGDAVTGPRTVIEAIAAGKKAAASIDCYIRGEEIPDPLTPEPRGEEDFLPATLQEKVERRRSQSPKLGVKERKGNFRQVDLGFTDEMALNEAKRCLRCDRCHGDGLCQFVCIELGIDALRLSSTEAGRRLAHFEFASTHTKCIGCGACAAVCPYGCIKVEDENAVRRLSFCGTVIAEHMLERCRICGAPFAAKRYLDWVKERSDDFLGVDVERNRCPACARRTRAERIAGEIQTV
jgi:NADH-quinone oxidoreductase subunit F